jgi:hypothetical protein
MPKTANEIKSSFELLASGHYQIHSFLYAQEFEQQAYENLIYPLMLVYPLGGNLSGTSYTRNYRVVIADRVLKSEGNELEVESDTQLIALDTLAYWMKLGTNERFSITSSNTITPFWEKWGDEVTGHFVDIGIEEFYDFNSCAIPLSSAIPSPSNPCKDARILINSVVYGNAPSDTNFNVVVKDQLGALVGSLIGGEWIVNTGGSCADSTYTITNSSGATLYTGTIPSGGSLTQAISNSTLNVNNSASTLISSRSILAQGTDSYNVADSVAVIKDSLGNTLKSENILATASENITINDSVAVIKDSVGATLKTENILAEATENISISDSVAVIKNSAGTTLKSENILAQASENITINDSTAVIKDSIGTTLKTEPILAEATENITINDSSVNVNKSDGTLISAVSVKAENTSSYNVGDSSITNAAVSPTYSQLVKATEGLILPTQSIQNNGVASGFIPSVGTINVTTNVAPTSFSVLGRTIDIVVPAGGGSYDLDLVDRFGNAFPTKQVSANATWDLRTLTPFDFADIFLNQLTAPSSTIQTAIIDLVDDLNAAGLWDEFYTIHPLVNGNANDHAVNLKYPFRKSSANLARFQGSPTHNANGITTNGSNNAMIIPLIPDQFANGGDRFAVSVYSRTDGASGSNLNTDIGGVSNNLIEITRIMIRTSANYQDAVMGGGASVYVHNNAYTGSALGLFSTYLGGATDGLARNGVNLTGGINSKSPSQQPTQFSAICVGGQWSGGTNAPQWNTARNYAYAASMKAWSLAQEVDHYNAVQTFQTTLGRQV